MKAHEDLERNHSGDYATMTCFWTDHARGTVHLFCTGMSNTGDALFSRYQYPLIPEIEKNAATTLSATPDVLSVGDYLAHS